MPHRNLPYVSGKTRFISGFLFGIAMMLMVTKIFQSNHFDYDNILRGVHALLSGTNPWAPTSRLDNFYNPPFAVLFLWILLLLTPKVIIIVGGAFIFALVFYWQAIPAMAWFLTNTFLFLVAAGSVDMFLIGSGISCLVASDRTGNKIVTTVLRVIGYGLLMVKFQGGIFIVLLYIWMRRDWKGLLICVLIYGIPFITLYPTWLHVLLTAPPQSQNEAAQSLWGKFGPAVAIPLALVVVFARKWKYWQLGGALAGILAPYGMVGLPIFLTLTAVRSKAAVPAIVIYSGCLAYITWVTPINPRLMAVYHLSMLGLALLLACLIPGEEAIDADMVPISLGALRPAFDFRGKFEKQPGNLTGDVGHGGESHETR